MISWDTLPGDIHYPDSEEFDGGRWYLKTIAGLKRYVVASRRLIYMDGDETSELVILSNVDTFDVASLVEYTDHDGGGRPDHRRYWYEGEYFDGYQTIHEQYCVDVYGWSPGQLDIIERHASVSR